MSEFDFEASLGEKFAERGLTGASEEETTPQTETSAETETAETERPRDEQGRFVAQEKILGKFDSQDELIKSYQELERAYHESRAPKDDGVAQLAAEVAALREQQSFTGYDFENPAAAAQQAYMRRDELGLRQALEAWRDEDPFGAAVFVSNIHNDARLNELRQEYEGRLEATQPIVQRSTYEQALTALAQQKPDLPQYAGLIPEVVRNDPDIARDLQSSNPSVVQKALRAAYYEARDRAGDNLQQAATNAQTEQTEETRAAKLEGAVASSSTQPSARGDQDAKDRFREGILNAEIGLVDRFAS